MRRVVILLSLLIAGGAVLLSSSAAWATLRSDVGYTTLGAELAVIPSAILPTGAGVGVAQIEVPYNHNYTGTPNPPWEYMPYTGYNSAELSGKTFTPEGVPSINYTIPAGFYANSNHAALVAVHLAGNLTSIAPGIASVQNYLAYDGYSYATTSSEVLNSWMFQDYLRARASSDGPSSSKPYPAPPSVRVATHSWIGYVGNTNSPYSPNNIDILMRMDYVVDSQMYLQVAAIPNASVGTRYPLVYQGFNNIAVGLTSQWQVIGTEALNTIYTANRTRPDVVVPLSATSYATPVVAGALTDLIQYAHTINPGISTGSINNPVAGTVYHAETPQVLRAAIMAGADRVAFNSDPSPYGGLSAITNYGANPTTNGLDTWRGAGQLNVRNSYFILAAGEQHAGNVASTGFDYGVNADLSAVDASLGNYTFNGDWTGQTFTASLVWHLKVNDTGADSLFKNSGVNYDTAAVLHNLKLALVDVTNGNSTIAMVNSTTENTQNIYAKLTQGHQYQLRVLSNEATGYQIDYGLAWSGKNTLGWSQGSGTWDIDTTAKWHNGNVIGKYYDGLHVVFSDQGGQANVTTNVTVNSGGGVAPGSIVFDSQYNYSLSGSAINGTTGIIKNGAGTATISNPLAFTGSVTVNSGSLILNGAGNTYTAKTDIIGGTLLANNTAGSATGTGAVTVFSGGTLGGSGAVAGAVTVNGGGILSPGNGVGTFSINNSLTLASNAILSFDLGFNPTGSNDLIAVANSLTLNPSTININAVNGDLANGTYKLLTYSGSGASTAGWTIGANNSLGSHFYTFSSATANEIDLIVTSNPAFLQSGDGTWTNGGGDHNWTTHPTTNGNWTGAYPIATGQTATFDNTGLAATTNAIALNGNRTLGQLTFNTTSGGYTVGLNNTANKLIMDNTGGVGNAAITASGGSHVINACVATSLASNLNITVQSGGSLSLVQGIDNGTNAKTVTLSQSGAGTLSTGNISNSGTLSLASNSNVTVGNVSGAGATTIGQNAHLTVGVTGTANRIVQNNLTINGTNGSPNASVTIAAGPASPFGGPSNTRNDNQVSRLTTLSIAKSSGSTYPSATPSTVYYGTLDITNNSLFIPYGNNPGDGQAAYSAIEDMVRAGYNGGDWLGKGITSSLAASNNPLLYGVNVYDNAIAGLTGYTSLSTNTIVVKYGYNGDTNGDGSISADDYTVIDLALAGSPMYYMSLMNGDTNHDGLISADDYTLIDINIQNSAANSSLNGGVNSVPLPEPSSFVLGALGLVGLLFARLKIRAARSGRSSCSSLR